MINVNLILGILSAIGVVAIVIGLVINEIFFWYGLDIYNGLLFAIMAYRLISLRNIKKQ